MNISKGNCFVNTGLTHTQSATSFLVRGLFFLALVLVLCVGTRRVCAAGSPKVAKSSVAVVVLTDTSGSMQDHLVRAITATSLVVAGLDDSVELELGSFGSKVELFSQRPQAATGARRRRLLERVSKLQANGGTDLLGALRAGLDLLETSQAPRKWLCLVTDGKQSPPAHLAAKPTPVANTANVPDVRLIGRQLARRAKARGVRILTVGLGEEIDRELLELLSTETEGLHVAIASPEELLPVYIDWLKTVGNYYVARDRNEVPFKAGDSHLKILTALRTAKLDAVYHNGSELVVENAGFERWEGRHNRLHILQARKPAQGNYRVSFQPAIGPQDMVLFLKQASPHWQVQLDFQPRDLLQPLIVVVNPSPERVQTGSWEVVAEIGKPTKPFVPIVETRLVANAKRIYRGTLFLDPKQQIQVAGVYNVRVRMNHRESGWSTERTQTIRFEAGHPRILAEVRMPTTVLETVESRSTVLDLGALEPNSTVPMELCLRATPSTKGRTFELSFTGGTLGLASTLPPTIVSTGTTQTIHFDLHTPTPFREGLVEGRLRLTEQINQRPPATSISGPNGSRTFVFRVRPKPIDLAVVFQQPDVKSVLRCGQVKRSEWLLEVEGSIPPQAKLRTRIVWNKPKRPHPGLEIEAGAMALLPLGKQTKIPFVVRVASDLTPGSYQGTLELEPIGDRPMTLAGKQTLSIPIAFDVEPELVPVRILDDEGNPLEKNTARVQVQSPVRDTEIRIRFTLADGGTYGKWKVRALDSESDSIHCQIESSSAETPLQFEAKISVGAQTAPGIRRFEFVIDGNAHVRPTPATQQFAIEVEIPKASVILGSPSGGPVDVSRELGYLTWLRELVGFESSWSDRYVLRASSTGLGEGIGYTIVGGEPNDLGPARSGTTLQTTKLWSIVHHVKDSSQGTFPIDVRVRCPYRHLEVHVADAPRSRSSRTGNEVVVRVGSVSVQRPGMWPLYLVGNLFVLVVAWAWLRRGYVSGKFLVRSPTQATTDFHPLVGTCPRLILDGNVFSLVKRWGAIWIRWNTAVGPNSRARVRSTSKSEQSLRPNGSWARLYCDDVLVVDELEAVFDANVARHPESISASMSDTTQRERSSAFAAGSYDTHRLSDFPSAFDSSEYQNPDPW